MSTEQNNITIGKMLVVVNMILHNPEFGSENYSLEMLKLVMKNKENEIKNKNQEQVEKVEKVEKQKKVEKVEPVKKENQEKVEKENQEKEEKEKEEKVEKENQEKVEKENQEKEEKDKLKNNKLLLKQKKEEKDKLKNNKLLLKQEKEANKQEKVQKKRGRPKNMEKKIVDNNDEEIDIQKMVMKNIDALSQDSNNSKSELSIPYLTYSINYNNFTKVSFEAVDYWVYTQKSNEYFKHGNVYMLDFEINREPNCGYYNFENKTIIFC